MKSLYYLLALVCLLSVSAVALETGQSPGAVSFLTIDGDPRVMENYGDRPGTVVVFLSARSPEVRKQLKEMSELYERYRGDEILFVGVVPNKAEEADELRVFQQNNGLRFPIYRDPEAAVAAQFGASALPEFFLLDKEGKLVYHGSLAYLEAAIRLLQAGQPVAVAETKAAGDAIASPGPALPTTDPYGTLYFDSELIFRKIPGVPVHHCSSLAEASNGDLLCLWYGGSYESAEDQALYLARLPKGSCQWSEPEQVLRNPAQPPGNAIIFRLPDGRMSILWGRMESPRPIRRGSGWGQCRIVQRSSNDNGTTWGEDREVEGSFGWLPRNEPVTLKNGDFCVPLSGVVEGKYGSFLLVLQADGSWQRRGFIAGGEQPTVVQRDNGELLCLMRQERRILQSVSADNGNTWTPATPTELKCPDSGIAMTKLKSGRILVAYNDTDQSDRTPFNLIQSTDDGKTWGEMKILEADWGEFSYPSLIQATDGMVHLSYTYRRFSIKHSAFDEGWLTILERPN